MNEIERTILVSAWRQALTSGDDSPLSECLTPQLLSGLLDELATALDADPFDATAGARVGWALAAAHPTGSAVPSISAQVLCRLATHSTRPDAAGRLAALLTELGRGFQAGLNELCRPPRECDENGPEAVRRMADERFRILFDNAAVAIAIGDTDGTLIEANRGLAEMIGVPAETLRGASVYDFAHPDDRDEIRTLVYEKLVPAGEGTVKLERRLMRADGSFGWAAFAITFVKGVGGQADYLLAVGEDVTERHRLQEELRRQARHDPLTGLPNRRHLLERLESAIISASGADRIGLCFADLDRFKHVNDRYGHGTGDQVLTAVADRFHASVSDHDCLVARIGGDEFVALIPPPTDDRRVVTVANRLLSALADPITVGEHRLQVSASIGVVLTPVAGAQAESLLDAADTGLYDAKTNGRGRWSLSSSAK
ncbi:diguanylate cyclase domain-containing protein [Nocardia transvalensis]|uniref:diguanylate cyclase domain-containing protein n=1 Tax=Nocardia transvalensis TaxID=37333 RepID=UPI00189599C1|nr:sensor domain-containing diguanylate cyclase [Nocardia transvalensis]MBF6332485.1 GGDEF domain-containing protein [Nocardia transvalensis]